MLAARPASSASSKVASGLEGRRLDLFHRQRHHPPHRLFCAQTQLLPPSSNASAALSGRETFPLLAQAGKCAPLFREDPEQLFHKKKAFLWKSLSSKEYHRNAVISSRIVRPASRRGAGFCFISRELSQFFRRFWGMRSESAIFFSTSTRPAGIPAGQVEIPGLAVTAPQFADGALGGGQLFGGGSPLHGDKDAPLP